MTRQRLRLSQGTELSFVTAGDTSRPALLLLHGFPGSVDYFRGIVPELSRLAHVIAADRALSAMRDGGRVACPHGVTPDPNIRPGVELIRYNGARGQEATDKLNRLIDSGPFDVHVARTFPFDEAVDAHRMLTTHYLGKLALPVKEFR